MIFAVAISVGIKWFFAKYGFKSAMLYASFAVACIAFFLQLFLKKRPLIELYSKGYPYRKLKVYGAISAIALFEFIIVWGLYTKQILFPGHKLFLISVVFIGAIVYYHLFVRLKVSLRFLFLAALVPAISAGAALGLGSYFKVLDFIIPLVKIGSWDAFLNTMYWILTATFFQAVCEEPAFRGFLMQGLLPKGELSAIVFSSIFYAVWRTFFIFTDGAIDLFAALAGSFISGVIFALLFVKGRNLLNAIIANGILTGLYKSIFAANEYPGIRQYLQFTAADSEKVLIGLWIFCLFVGLILLTFIPRKNLNAR